MKPTLNQVLTELQKRNTKQFHLSEYLFDKQLEFVQDPARFKTAVTTRRAGKTVSCAADLIATALEHTQSVCLYITLARTNAKKLVWREIKKIDREFNLGISFNESELSATTANGSLIYCSGASDRTEIEKFRGLALHKVYIDECQSFPAYIADLIDDVIAPALMDYEGTLVLIGTPGPVPTGYFYDCSHSASWAHYSWTFWNNPHIKNPQKVFDEELQRRGVNAENPSIQREWFGRWVLDTEALVYQYKSPRNDYEKLPEEKFTYILGVDLGFNDADALAVLAWSDSSSTTYLVDEIITRKQGITELVEQIEAVRKKYDISKIVMDQGGLGKKIAEEIIRRYQIPVIAAEKQRKFEYIELMNDALRTGRFKSQKGSRFSQDSMKVEWDLDKTTPDKKVISKRFHSDICEAALYAWRESYSFTHRPTKAKPVKGTPAWNQEMQDELEAKAEEYFQAMDDAEKGFQYE